VPEVHVVIAQVGRDCREPPSERLPDNSGLRTRSLERVGLEHALDDCLLNDRIVGFEIEDALAVKRAREVPLVDIAAIVAARLRWPKQMLWQNPAVGLLQSHSMQAGSASSRGMTISIRHFMGRALDRCQ
jgi:hypothetical protein